MGTSSEKHARQQANRRAGDEIRRQQEASRRRRSLLLGGATLALCIVIVVGLVVLTGKKGDENAGGNKGGSGATTTTATSGSSSSSPGEAAELPSPPPGATLTEPTKCPPESGSAERVEKFAGPPPDCLDDGATYKAVFDTTEGSFTAVLDAKAAPLAVNNFVVLSRYHFYDGVPFHRVVSEFVIQGGDGDGPPWGNNDLGYSFADELPASSAAYTDYSLAMANAGANTNGSQFFVVLPGGGPKLGPLYSRFGEVTEGRDVVDAIGKLDDGNQQPTKAVVIKSVRIEESKGQ